MTTDAEIDEQVAQLCGGYDRPFTPERRDAFRKGMRKMHPAMLGRVVEHCLGEHGPEKFPTCRELWQISAMLRRRGAAVGRDADSGPPMSDYALAANRALLKLAYCDVRRGFRPIAEYAPRPPGGCVPLWPPGAPINRSRLDAVLAAKREIVALAEEARAAGEPWDDDEFEGVLRERLEALLLPKEHGT